jgi:hypothetical protein
LYKVLINYLKIYNLYLLIMYDRKKYDARYFKSQENFPKYSCFKPINLHRDWNKDIKDFLTKVKEKVYNIE